MLASAHARIGPDHTRRDVIESSARSQAFATQMKATPPSNRVVAIVAHATTRYPKAMPAIRFARRETWLYMART